MKRFKNIILFIITLLAIFLLDFIIYKNIDELIPKHQNELHKFANNINKNENSEFLYELCVQIENSDNYRKVLGDSQTIKENNIVYNLIKNYTYEEEIPDDYIIDILSVLDIGDLSNTIYGDLEFVTSRYMKGKKYVVTNYYIAYSKDMKKICYYNNDKNVYDESTASQMAGIISDATEKQSGAEAEKTQLEKNKEEIIKCVKEEFSRAVTNIDFNPNIITYRGGSYILEDEGKDITVYYNKELNSIYGFYIGFGI